MSKLLRCVFLLCTAFWFSGCAAGVFFKSPLAQSPGPIPEYFPQQKGPLNTSVANPVTQFDAFFTGAYKPGGKFQITLDGQDISKSFTPAPVPASTRSAQYTTHYYGGTSVPSTPGFAAHVLRADSECVPPAWALFVNFCVNYFHQISFIPPQLRIVKNDSTDYNKQPPYLHSAAGFHVLKVVVQNPTPSDITVTIREGTVNANGQVVPSKTLKLQLDYKSPGTAISVVIPKGAREAPFSIFSATGSAAEFNLAATAPGCQAVWSVGNTDK